MNRKAVKFFKSELAPPEILIPFGHCRLLPNLSISVRRSNTGLGLFYGNSMLMSHAQSGSHIWTWAIFGNRERRISSLILWNRGTKRFISGKQDPHPPLPPRPRWRSSLLDKFPSCFHILVVFRPANRVSVVRYSAPSVWHTRLQIE